MTLTRYGQVIASASGFAFLSFGVVLAYYGKIRIPWSRLLSSLAAALIVAGGFVWAARSFDRRVLKRESNPYLSFQLDLDVTRGVNVSLAALDSAEPLPQGLSVLARIQQSGELRVGYNSGIIPFCYLNSSGDLVGYDVAYAYQLARDLNVRLRLIPFQEAAGSNPAGPRPMNKGDSGDRGGQCTRLSDQIVTVSNSEILAIAPYAPPAGPALRGLSTPA